MPRKPAVQQPQLSLIENKPKLTLIEEQNEVLKQQNEILAAELRKARMVLHSGMMEIDATLARLGFAPVDPLNKKGR